MEAKTFPSCDYDVVVLGGALAGASTALLLRRRYPHLRLLVIEKTPRFQRRVGEATVEVSAYFLGRVLGLTRYLNESHLVKQGMRFWFANEHTHSLSDSSEIGGRYLVRLPSYQLDRAALDEQVLRLAVESGVSLLRPCRFLSVTLNEGGLQQVQVSDSSGSRTITARWVVDASGFAAFLSRQEGWYETNDRHPTAAVWARWTGVKDWDGAGLAEKYPEWASACYGIRGTATNHLIGDGWWAWMIPLKGGDTSVGVVWDQRHVQWSSAGSLGEQLKAFLLRHPVGKELLEHATCIEGDVHRRSRLAYSSRRYAGDGFVLVGDAAAFLDPLYSPGMDWLTYTVTRAVNLVSEALAGEEVKSRVEKYQNDFSRSYERWFAAIYQDKYDHLGDFELMRTAFRLDLALYYLGVVSQPFLRGEKFLATPSFTTPPSIPVYHLIRTYNRRLAAMGRERRRRGCFGRRNSRARFLLNGFAFDSASVWAVAKALGSWLSLEVTEGWRSWFRSNRGSESPSSLSHPIATPAQAVAMGAVDGTLR